MKENCSVVFSHLGPVVTLCTAGFKVKKFHVLRARAHTHALTQCVCVFFVALRRNICLLAAARLVIRSLLSYCAVFGVGLHSKMVDQVTVVSVSDASFHAL